RPGQVHPHAPVPGLGDHAGGQEAAAGVASGGAGPGAGGVRGLRRRGLVAPPAGQELPLGSRQVGPGRYEAEFEASGVGIYSVTGTFEGSHGEKGYLSQGVPLSYAAEYRALKFNPSLLNQLHERTGGRRLGLETPVYAPLSRSAGI